MWDACGVKGYLRCAAAGLQVVTLMAAISSFSACDKNPSAGAHPSATAVGGAGSPVAKGKGVTVIRSATPKVSEAAFMKALDKQLDIIFVELRNKPYRSQVQMIAILGARMQSQAIMRETRIAMGVSDVSLLSLFASTPGVSKRVGQHVQQRAKVESSKLKELTKHLSKVVADDCREAAIQRISLQALATGKRQATLADKANAPMVALLLNECKTAAEAHPEYKCYLEAADEAAIKACKVATSD